MRIAYLCNRYPSVSHSFVRREIVGVEAAGHVVDRYTVRNPGPIVDAGDQTEQLRTTVILAAGAIGLGGALLRVTLHSPRQFVAALVLTISGAGWSPKGVVRALAYLGEAAWLVERFRKAPVDHLHAHFGTNPTAVARLVRRLGGPPYSFTAHGPDEFDRPEALELRAKIADARLVVAISSFGRSQLMRWSDPRDWRKLTVVRCGVDAGFLDAAPRPAPSAPRFAAVARLNAQKGLPVLVEAAALLKARGRDFHIAIAGDGELRGMLTRRIAESGLEKHIQLLGAIDGAGIRQLLEDSRIFVLPSFAEGLPVVIMEALALQRPVIASAIAGTPELVDAGCGWLVPAGSPEAVADAMEMAIDASDETIAAMGCEGRRRVAEQYNAARNARSLIQAIEAYPAC